jgi:hypothetical protein
MRNAMDVSTIDVTSRCRKGELPGGRGSRRGMVTAPRGGCPSQHPLHPVAVAVAGSALHARIYSRSLGLVQEDRCREYGLALWRAHNTLVQNCNGHQT